MRRLACKTGAFLELTVDLPLADRYRGFQWPATTTTKSVSGLVEGHFETEAMLSLIDPSLCHCHELIPNSRLLVVEKRGVLGIGGVN